MNKEHQLMQEVWRRALRQGKVEMVFKTPQDAIRTRFALYNAVKRIREGKEVDPELQTAVSECIVRVIKPATLIVEQKLAADSVQAVMGSLGLTMDDIEFLPEPTKVKTAEELSQERFLQKLNNPAPAKELSTEELRGLELTKKYRGY